MLPIRPTLLAALLAAASSAHADLRLSESATGDALYLPYYTVEDDQETLLTIRNGSDRFSAVRVVFSEALNGQNVFSFNLYLPPHALWTGALSGAGSAAATIAVTPGICNVPMALGDGAPQPFHNRDYAVRYPDGGGSTLQRTRFGAIEIFEFASLEGDLAQEVFDNDCAALDRRYQRAPDGTRANLLPMMQAPAGRLSANAQVVNVAQGYVYSFAAIAIEGFFAQPQDPDPDALLPRLTTPVIAAGQQEFVVRRRDDRLAFAADRGADAVSALFMTEQLSGEVVVRDEAGFTTQWVVAFPTRHAYVADLPHSLATDGRTVAPFSAEFGERGACESVATRRTPALGGAMPARIPVVFPPTSGDTFCGQVNRRVIGVDGDMLIGSDAIQLRGARRSITARRLGDGATVQLEGLPAVGLRLAHVINNHAAPNVVANYSFAQPLLASDSTHASE